MGLPSDSSFGIGGSIDIVCMNGFQEAFQGEICLGSQSMRAVVSMI